MSFGNMEATAITTIAFIFAASAVTVVITLCYKGGNGTGSRYQKRHHGKVVVTSREKISCDIETADGVGPDIAVAPVEASIIVCGGGGSGGGRGGGGGGEAVGRGGGGG
ncbi:hypothetical protein HanPI659440_Chr03g0118481 [Helianthus annuus]|nr:hypothetical protein HanPI659440_Chr03g0118481 [Helianthus annuus]